MPRDRRLEVRVNQAAYDVLAARASERGITISELVRRLLREGVATMKPVTRRRDEWD